MSFREQLTITTAPSGAGKTYVRCARFLVNEFLPMEKGVSWSNFPIKRENILQHFQGSKSDEEFQEERQELERRLQSIPEMELQSWQSGLTGPWDFFQDKDLTGAHIQIDEAHLYVRKDKIEQWAEWLGAVRHAGGTVELISQTPGKIPRSVKEEAGSKISLIDSQGTVDPFFKIQMADWYELKAKFTGRYVSYFVESRTKRYDEKFKHEKSIYHARDPKFFSFYDSYNQVGKVQGSQAQEHKFEQLSIFGLLRWFYVRNFWTLTIRGFVSIAGICLILGLPFIAKNVMTGLRNHQIQKMSQVSPGKTNLNSEKGKFNRLSEWPQPELSREDVKKLQAELDMAHKTVLSQANEFQRLKTIHENMIARIVKAKQANDLIGMLFKDKAVTVGGRVVTIGDIINTIEGEKEIKAFDYENSRIEFTDATSHWVTIGQRRLQDSAQLPESRTDEEAYSGAAGKGPGAGGNGVPGTRELDNLPGTRTTPFKRHLDNRTTNQLNDNSQSKPVIHSRYVGTQ